jgi:hypothetical protein
VLQAELAKPRGCRWIGPQVMKRVKGLLPLAAALLVLPSTLLNATAASGNVLPFGQGRIKPEILAQMHTQYQLDLVADRVKALGRIPSLGFSGVILAPERSAMTVYWHGPVPAAVQAEADHALSIGLNVTIAQAPYSRVTLQGEADRLLTQAHTAPATSADVVRGTWRVTSVSARQDGTGLNVGVNEPPGLSPALPSGLNANLALGVPVTVTRQQPQPTNRYNDSEPWRGGDKIADANGNGCSDAFSVTLQGGTQELMSAAHCDPNGNQTWSSNGSVIGVPQRWNPQFDAMLIGHTQSAGGTVYGGAIPTSGFPHFAEWLGWVEGISESNVGDFVCADGAFSGEQCNIKVTEVNVALDDPTDGHMVHGLVRVQQVDGTTVSGKGDSGGPVFKVTNKRPQDNDEEVLATGVIWGGNLVDSVPCPTPSISTNCSSSGWFEDIGSALIDTGATVDLSFPPPPCCRLVNKGVVRNPK